jgi:hypothetical protein
MLFQTNEFVNSTASAVAQDILLEQGSMAPGAGEMCYTNFAGFDQPPSGGVPDRAKTRGVWLPWWLHCHPASDSTYFRYQRTITHEREECKQFECHFVRVTSEAPPTAHSPANESKYRCSPNKTLAAPSNFYGTGPIHCRILFGLPPTILIRNNPRCGFYHLSSNSSCLVALGGRV